MFWLQWDKDDEWVSPGGFRVYKNDGLWYYTFDSTQGGPFNTELEAIRDAEFVGHIAFRI